MYGGIGIFLFTGGIVTDELTEVRECRGIDNKRLESVTILFDLVFVTREDTVENEICEEEGPFGLYVFKDTELVRFVMKTRSILNHRLMTIAKETFASVFAAKFCNDFAFGSLNEVRVMYSKCGKSNDG